MNRTQKLRKAMPWLYKLYLWIQRGPMHEVNLIKVACSDYWRYRKYSFRDKTSSVDLDNLTSVIIKYAHSIEKGFSMPEFRPGFGRSVLEALIVQMAKYDSQGYDHQTLAYQKAQSVLAEYISCHKAIDYDLGEFRDVLMPWVDESSGVGGYTEINGNEMLASAAGDFAACAISRRSVRNYRDKRVNMDDIRDAVRIARQTPSACNRQCWHTYIIRDPEMRANVLALQNGNRGFGHCADFVAVITADMKGFAGAGERHGTYIDGGLYAMSLMYALHYKGIGTCPLNWMVLPSVDKKLRQLLRLSPSENTIMMISGGLILDHFRVAKSARKSIDDQLTIL
ncbi:nitroreductase family protein [Novipirellula sp.]|uniref:nitroreductase family protein n=1 Tax=Novipirellula sp. TaxID=2795430 RepID=UPI0035645C26